MTTCINTTIVTGNLVISSTYAERGQRFQAHILLLMKFAMGIHIDKPYGTRQHFQRYGMTFGIFNDFPSETRKLSKQLSRGSRNTEAL